MFVKYHIVPSSSLRDCTIMLSVHDSNQCSHVCRSLDEPLHAVTSWLSTAHT